MSGFDHSYFTYPLIGLLATGLVLCSIYDFKYRRIPNKLTYLIIFTSLTIYSFIDGLDGFAFSCCGLAFGFIILLFPYLMGGMGAGDVKLMSAVGAVLGFQQTAICFLFVAICGGIMALGFMIYRRILKETLLKTFLGMLYLGLHQDASLLKVDKNTITQEGIPYGVAIAGGVFLFFLYQTMNGKPLPAL